MLGAGNTCTMSRTMRSTGVTGYVKTAVGMVYLADEYVNQIGSFARIDFFVALVGPLGFSPGPATIEHTP